MIRLRSGSYVAGVRPRVEPTPADLHLVSHGDSLAQDFGRFNYLFVLASLILAGQGLHASVYQHGINGISYDYRWPSEPYDQTMITDAPLTIDLEQVAGIPNWLLVFAGTNGMEGGLGAHSAATEYANFKTYIAARIAAGWTASRIVVVTMLPRTGFTDAVRQTFNASLVGDDGAYGYTLARVDQNTDIGEAGDDANATYFYGGIHPTAAGHAIIADTIDAVMFP